MQLALFYMNLQFCVVFKASTAHLRIKTAIQSHKTRRTATPASPCDSSHLRLIRTPRFHLTERRRLLLRRFFRLFCGLQSLRKSIFRDSRAGRIHWRGAKPRSIYNVARTNDRRHVAESLAIDRRRRDRALQRRHERRFKHGPGTFLRILRFADR